MVRFAGKISIIAAASIICLSLNSCGDKKDAATGNKPKGLKSEGFIVSPQSFSSTYAASGSLLPNEQIDIHPEISGRVTAILFKEGSNVSEGQTLVQLYDGELRAQLQKLKAQRDLQAKTLERQKDLLNIGGISKQDFETTQTQLQSLEADIAYTEAQIRATRIVAPFSGTIGIRNISVGAVVSPATVISTLQQVHQLKIDFNIPEQYRHLISAGSQVKFTAGNGTDTLTAKISAIDPGADAATRTVRVRVIVPNAGNKLVAGSFAQVLIPLERNNNAILVPSQAVIPTTRDKKIAVVKEGKATLVTVTLGERTSDKAEVLTGLNAGDTILLTGLMQVKPGMDVSITKVHN